MHRKRVVLCLDSTHSCSYTPFFSRFWSVRGKERPSQVAQGQSRTNEGNYPSFDMAMVMVESRRAQRKRSLNTGGKAERDTFFFGVRYPFDRGASQYDFCEPCCFCPLLADGFIFFFARVPHRTIFTNNHQSDDQIAFLRTQQRSACPSPDATWEPPGVCRVPQPQRIYIQQ